MDTTDKHQHDVLCRESIRTALQAWGSAKSLSAHPLAELEAVQVRRQAAGFSDSPSGHGLALRETLREAIEALRPSSEMPDPREKRWRPYIILQERFLHGRTPDCIATDLNISRRAYYNEQKHAVEAVAEILGRWEEEVYLGGTIPIGRPDSALSSTTRFEHSMPFMAPPRPPNVLVGREGLLAELKRQLLESQDIPLTALQGLPGVGKTTLAIELAHDPEVRSRFSDGVLWVGLGRQPDVLALLGGWAVAVQVPAEGIARHTSLAERARAVHAAIGMRRMLLVIDDAWRIGDALAFKIGGPHCAHLITTRLASVATDFAGESTMTVRELDAAEGLDLLAQLAPRVVEGEREEAAALVQAVGGLPLALILMGGHLRKQSHGDQSRRLRQALVQLEEAETRLRLAQPQSPLEQQPSLASDTPLSLQASIGLSDAALDALARRALRDLSLFPPKPNTFSEAAAMAVMNAPASLLDTLVDHGLVEGVGTDHYTLHQTISDYARLEQIEPEGTRRYVSYFTQYIVEHADENEPLELERSNLLMALEFAFHNRWSAELIRGVNALYPFLMNRGLYSIAELHLGRALSLMPETNDADRYTFLFAREHAYDVLGKREAQRQDLVTLERLAEALDDYRRRAQVAQRWANYDEGIADYAAAIAAAQAAIEMAQIARANDIQAEGYLEWGWSLCLQGDYAAARAQLERALALACEARTCSRAPAPLEPLLRLEMTTLCALGNVACAQGDYAKAQAHYEQDLCISREIGDQRSESAALNRLGGLYGQLGDYAHAQTCHEQALRISRESGVRRDECYALVNWGLLSHQMGDNEAARRYGQEALQIGLDIGARNLQGRSLTILGHAVAGLKMWTEAVDAYRRALDLYRELGRHRQATGPLAGLARISLARGELALALGYVEETLNYLKIAALDGTDEPIRVYLTCYRVLCANQDPRAPDVLMTAYHLLQERAAKITDENLRRLFLENLVAHRELLATWEMANNGCG
jgi:tetratricopeptide (TPR) repeat protein